MLAASVTLLAIATLAGAKPGSDAPAVLRAQSFELVDGEGRPHAIMNVDPTGETQFSLFDSGDLERVRITATDSRAGVYLLRNGKEVAALVNDKNEVALEMEGPRGGRLVLAGKQLRPRIYEGPFLQLSRGECEVSLGFFHEEGGGWSSSCKRESSFQRVGGGIDNALGPYMVVADGLTGAIYMNAGAGYAAQRQRLARSDTPHIDLVGRSRVPISVCGESEQLPSDD